MAPSGLTPRPSLAPHHKVMGRTEPSIGRPPAAFRRDARAKKAKATLNKLIPSLLSAHPRARRGIDASELIVAPPAGKPGELGTSDIQAGPRLTIQVADTLTAARALMSSPGEPVQRVAILSMCSPLSPGGGFLNGATSQEEYLCMRTTLLLALRDDFYRLPELGCVYTPDVLVFRASSDDAENDLLEKRDRWFVDVVSAAMLRLPETEVDEETGRSGYVYAQDRELVMEKMKAVMRVFQAKGASKVVLGAWGCGAYGNPVGEIARAWRRVLLDEGKKGKRRERWGGIQEVVFAVKDASMAGAFATAFGDALNWADNADDEDGSVEDDGADQEAVVDELRARIEELRVRIDRAPDANVRVKEGLQAVMAGLESQMPGEGAFASPSAS